MVPFFIVHRYNLHYSALFIKPLPAEAGSILLRLKVGYYG